MASERCSTDDPRVRELITAALQLVEELETVHGPHFWTWCRVMEAIDAFKPLTFDVRRGVLRPWKNPVP
jgi:hypothetical protein